MIILCLLQSPAEKKSDNGAKKDIIPSNEKEETAKKGRGRPKKN